jgi:hypothetical protein
VLAGKLTYANVTSTLALCLALAGGVAYGAQAIVDSSKDVASQSITNSDVKKEALKSNRLKDGAAVSGADVVPNSLGGASVNEADLAQVPSAATAGTAADAATLGGLGAGQFARSAQIQVGGPVGADATTQTPIVTLPNLGLEIRTDGDADIASEVRLVNTNAPGGPTYLVVYGIDNQNAFNATPGSNTVFQPGDAIDGGVIQIVSRNAPAAGALVTCAFSIFDSDRRVSCFAVTS